MSEELSAAEKAAEEVLIDLMTERVMPERGLSIGVESIIHERAANLSVNCSSQTILTSR
jgi:hypothetical protein